jgi:hypothetical protein
MTNKSLLLIKTCQMTEQGRSTRQVESSNKGCTVTFIAGFIFCILFILFH